ncbi:hypothetical protein QL285_018645 [Trifolium repens]|nr:hypothetical protein QL285_018645 [Trifolium repens]
MLKLIPKPLITELALEYASVTNLINLCFQRHNGLPFFVEWIMVNLLGEPATATSLIRAGALQNATVAGPGAAHTYSDTANWKSPSLGQF